MTEIQRWLDTGQAQPEVLELLRMARPPSSLDARTRARSRQYVAALGAFPVAGGALLWLKSVALGAVLGGVATAAVLAPKWRTEHAQEVSAPRVGEPTRHDTSMRRVASPTAEPPARSSTAPPEPVPQPPSANVGIASLPAPQPESAVSNDLAREIQLLERARQLLGVNPALALETLNEHQREFGDATLVLEREFLMVETLLRLGRPTEARAQALELRRRAPASLYERRLSQVLGSADKSTPRSDESGEP